MSLERADGRPKGPGEPGDGTSLYVHVPFCVVKCGYCDFNSFASDRKTDGELFDRFLGALGTALRREAPRQPVSVFVGGGTPTHLDDSRFERLMMALATSCDLSGCSEVTIEANPESVTPGKARSARSAGVRRVSIGAQSFDSAALRFLDRAHDAAAVGRAVEVFRAAGFDNVSLDMIYALPGQTVDAWRHDLDAGLALEPDHMSCYALTYEPGTRLTHRVKQGDVDPIDGDTERAMFEATHTRLAGAGFDAYEVSNFAGRGGPCMHNDHYWLQGDYVGIGPGAASHRGGWRSTALKPVDAWCSAVERGLPATGEAETLDRRTRAGEAVWLGLRRRDGVDLERIGRRTGVDVRTVFADALGSALKDGLAILTGDVLRLAEPGRPYADVVGGAFLMAPRNGTDGGTPNDGQ